MSRVLAVTLVALVALVGVAVPLVGTWLAGGIAVILTFSVVIDYDDFRRVRSTR